MRILTILLCAGNLLGSSFAADKTDLLSDDHAKLNYSVGYQIGSDFRQQNFELRTEAVLQGIQDAMSGSEQQMTAEEMRNAMAEMGKQVAELKKQKREQIGQYQQANEQFLLDNAKKSGVTVTESGLQFRVIEQGGGIQPKSTDRVLVNYRGRLIDGTEFDSSHKRNKPSSFRVDQVIKGWSEALQLMQRGSHWQLVIPAHLGYGERGMGNNIPPNSTLIFDVELLSVQ
ncbi:MAG: FKBP-type peptidyl-prolyl cis-trans isomerase [Gammaproteobacteria bacterium]|nr:FKBP-type peptidyl-prolyl cis-trans isomerase [Gammaproteobacteria bacterium]MBL7000654.1 FKBP-type peptidyl-prolyl cis-trans isomerase [Gammaproteobacteria bacterium]